MTNKIALKLRGKKYAVSHRKKLGKHRWKWVHTQRSFRTKQSAENWINRRERRRGTHFERMAFPRVVKIPNIKRGKRILKGGVGLYDLDKHRWVRN